MEYVMSKKIMVNFVEYTFWIINTSDILSVINAPVDDFEKKEQQQRCITGFVALSHVREAFIYE